MKNKVLCVSIVSIMSLWLYPDLINGQNKKIRGIETKDVSSYSNIITSNSVTQTGLFTYHYANHNHYFEIPRKLLGKEILIASRLSSTPHQFSPYGPGVYANRNGESKVIKFQKHENSIFIRLVPYDVAIQEGPLEQALRRSNFAPIVYDFKIAAINPESDSYLVQIDEFFTQDVPLIGIKRSNISGLDPSRSMITNVKVFNTSVEVRHILTYRFSDSAENGSLSFELNQSFVLLPDHPMTPRLHDERIYFSSINRTDYSSDKQRTLTKRYITRWRLEPSNWPAFDKGDLVEPVRPIIYYIDPATPEVWTPYIKKGVEGWRHVFEKAGFTNAILVKDWPSVKGSLDWDIDYFQYSVIRYIPTERGTAASFTVIDPRSGEILKADIHFGQGHLEYLKKLFFIQTAAANPDARSPDFGVNVMGELISSVISHEVGHTLGLEHNMMASSVYPVDSLRSPRFTSLHGLSSSIMDYAWGNYIAQPEDGVSNFCTRIGEYDYLAIKYGYRPIKNNISPESEKAILTQWIKEKEIDLHYRSLSGTYGDMDLGDDPIEACKLGVANLRIITENLIGWTERPNKDYSYTKEVYEELYRQFYRCLESVALMVGGKQLLGYNNGLQKRMYRFVPKQEQRMAIRAIGEYLFQTPRWLVNSEIQQRILFGSPREESISRIRNLHQIFLDGLMQRQIAMMENEALNGKQAYSIHELQEDLRNEVFSELRTGADIDIYRRNIQKIFVTLLKNLIANEADDYINTDIRSVCIANLVQLRKEIVDNLSRHTDKASKFHLKDLIMQIERTLGRMEGK